MQKKLGFIVAAFAVPLLTVGQLCADDNETGETVIRLQNSQQSVATWTNRGVHGFSIQRGDGSWHRVERTSYVLRLRYSDFDPMDGVPDIPDHLRVEDPGQGDNVYIVQFVTQPIEEYRRDIRLLGGTIYKYLANHSYLVRLDEVSRDAVEQLPYIRWVGTYEPAYKLEAPLLASVQGDVPQLPPTRVNIMVFERGLAQKNLVADRIEALGGAVHELHPSGFRFEATVDGVQLIDIANMPEVMWIDVWSEREVDMNIARAIGGANYIETVAGYTGQGVRGEVFDTNLFDAHGDFQAIPPIFHGPRSGSDDHGTGTYGINFGDGSGDPTARGMIPSAQGIFADFGFLGDRYQHTAELVQSPYFAVFQSNSWGNSRTTAYTSVSAEMDDIIFINDILITQSQSNANSQLSRPQAWAKNIVAVGGVNHLNTETKSDDFWGGASIGPAEDGRVKPDLVHFYDSIWTTDDAAGGYRNFCCTSGATPIVAGHFGLFYQMWSEGIFGNDVDPNGTVFDNRSHAATAKAMMINHACSYPFSGSGHNLTRTHQGWGLPDLMRMYDMRGDTFVVDEDMVLENLDTATYSLALQEGAPEFRATLVYADLMGTTSSSQHRINDLTLKVTSPGGTIYWGNNGLLTGNWSTAGGSANTIDTVENVFVENPESGTWTVEVIASEINEDAHVETNEVDADFGLVVSGVVPLGGVVADVLAVDTLRGSPNGGGIPELLASDDTYYRTLSGFGPSFLDLHSMILQVAANTDVPSPNNLTVRIESRIDEPSGLAEISLLNFVTGEFDVVHVYGLTDSDATETIGGLDAGLYVDGSGSISMQIKHVVFVPFLAFQFESFLDLIEIEVN